MEGGSREAERRTGAALGRSLEKPARHGKNPNMALDTRVKGSKIVSIWGWGWRVWEDSHRAYQRVGKNTCEEDGTF